MSMRIETNVAGVFRRGRNREIQCRLTYEVTSLDHNLFRWFLIRIEELE